MSTQKRITRFGWHSFIAGITLIAVSVACVSAARANDDNDESNYPVVQGVRFGQIPYEFEQTMYSHRHDYYGNRTFSRQLKWIFGPFPENGIARDGKDVHKLYLDTMNQQMNAGPIIRTVDLQNPFQYSLRTLPPPVVAVPVQVIEPPPTVIAPPMTVEPVKPVKPAPVPALW